MQNSYCDHRNFDSLNPALDFACQKSFENKVGQILDETRLQTRLSGEKNNTQNTV